jgi:ferrous iron transport protein B
MRLALIGNPNAGKSTIFSHLNSSSKEIANWPGVTVDKIKGSFVHNDTIYELIDLPGIYSLSQHDNLSPDEHLTLDFLKEGEFDLIVNVIDAVNFERSLYLTVQLLEMKVPLLLVVNMQSKALKKSIEINLEKFAQIIGVPAVFFNGKDKNEINKLKEFIASTSINPHYTVIYPELVANAVSAVAAFMHDDPKAEWKAIKLLENDSPDVKLTLATEMQDEVEKQIKNLESIYKDDIDIIIMAARYNYIASIERRCVRKGEVSHTLTDKIDAVVLHSYFALPIFLVCMYLLFSFSIIVGGYFQGLFLGFLNNASVDWLGWVFKTMALPDWLSHILRNGLGQGVAMVFSFVPLIAALYFGLSLLEDSGYMVRAAFILEKYFRKLNLSGNSFVPLILGLGCNVPAIMAARSLSNEKDRIATIMMVPFMSCGARLSVYTLFGIAFFQHQAPNIIFLLYLIGIIMALFTGVLVKKFISQGKVSYFMMELPNYDLPTLKVIFAKTWAKVKDFVLGAGKIIIMVFLVMQLFSSFDREGKFIPDNLENSLLADMGKGLTKVLSPMGIEKENWHASVAILTGVVAKEAVIGTLGVLHNQGAKTLQENLLLSFYGKIGAFAYMLFILLYFPCISVFAVICKELGVKWALLSALWSTGFAYMIAVTFYQLANLFSI